MFSITTILYLTASLFCIGIYGVLARRNIIVVLMSLELMLNAVNLALVAFGRVHGTASFAGEHSGQIFTLMVLAVAAAEAAIGLSLLLVIWRRWHSIDVRKLSRMSG
ncbi:MAG TPA: NADH-quinone oxidoreductase subunit NuoK [Planctomycetes bacterium]|nr:NADH-quinone oxidoreductase subunit NuoK [Planctomycetota bacterium]HIN80848.1 NADH-quinone oxidoreductase subunit NuoK [Planctomycetota bacterium]